MHRVLAFALPIACAAAACGAEEAAPPPEPDAATSQLACEPRGDSPSETVPLAVGLSANGTFSELADGDTCPLVIGYQGFLMMVVELRAPMPISFEGICLDCVTTVSPAASFAGVVQRADTQFHEQPDGTFSGFSSIVLGEKTLLEDLDDAVVDLSIECGGHGLTADVARTLLLDIPN